MTRTAKQSVGLFLIVAALGVLAWRLWPDGGRARQQQRDRDLVRAVQTNDLNAAIRLLNEGADPNVQVRSPNIAEKVQGYYYSVSHRMKPPDWRHMDDSNPHLSVLQIAASHGNRDMVRVLLSRGADAGYRERMFRNRAVDMVESRKGMMPPAAWNASSYPHIIVLLKAAEAQCRPVPHR